MRIGGLFIGLQRKTLGFFALSFIWGSTWLAIRIVVKDLPPVRGVSFRFLLAAALLLPLMFLRRSRLPRGAEWLILLFVSLFMMALPFSLTAWAEQWISSGETSVFFATSPLLTAVAECWTPTGFRWHRLHPVAVSGLFLGLAGAVVLLSHSLASSRVEGKGAGAILLVVVLGAISTVLGKRLLRDIPVLTVSAVSTLGAGLFLGCVSVATESGRPSAWTPASITALLFLGVFSSAIGFLLYYWLLKEFEPHQLAARTFLMPLVALTEGTIYLHERMSWTLLVGMLAILAGLALVLRHGLDSVPKPRADAPR